MKQEKAGNPRCPDCDMEKFNGNPGRCASCGRAYIKARQAAYRKSKQQER